MAVFWALLLLLLLLLLGSLRNHHVCYQGAPAATTGAAVTKL
jgi:hypothetical protein